MMISLSRHRSRLKCCGNGEFRGNQAVLTSLSRSTIQPLEQLDQGQWRLGQAALVARKGIDAAAEDFGGLALSEVELLAHIDDEDGVNNGRVHLLVKRLHLAHDALGFGHISDGLIARGAKVRRHRRNHSGFTFL